jgi:hypothetical protein
MSKNNYEKIYVAGFPKSGNTWLTRLLADILDSPAGTGMKGDDNKEIASDSNDEILKRNNNPKYKILKTHFLFPFLQKEIDNNIKKIVYIKRDFRDVVISAFFHHEKINEKYVMLQSSKELKENNISLFTYLKKRRRLWLHLIKICRQWSANVGSWDYHIDSYKNINNSQIAIAYTSYEKLKGNTYSEIKKILNDLKIETPKDEKILTAIKNQSFDKKKESYKNISNDENIPLGKEFNQKFLRKGGNRRLQKIFIKTNAQIHKTQTRQSFIK